MKMRINILRGEGDLKFIFPCKTEADADFAAAWLSKRTGMTVQLTTYEGVQRAAWHEGILTEVKS